MLRGIGVVAFVMVSLLGTAGPAAADDGRFAVTVEPDRTGALAAGDEVTYAIEVTNPGAAVDEAVIVQMLPAGFQSVESEPAGEVRGAQLIWTVPIEAGASATLSHTVTAGTADQMQQGQLVRVEQPDMPSIAEGAAQFSSTVCVRDAADDESRVCASAWQQLDNTEDDGIPTTWIWAAAAVIATAALAGAWWWSRRRRAS
jgi:uncharacterized repeat protein (TIGR01451 family)